MTVPSVGIAAILNAAAPAVVDGATGWPLSLGRLLTTSNRCVALIDGGGRTPEVKVAIDYPTVQVLVRGNKTEYEASREKAKEIFNILQAHPTPTVDYPELVSSVAATDIAWLGYDPDGERPMWSLNFNLIVNPAAIGHRDW
jgi:hypothetical protein